jgi:site-specific recombinase XerD
LVELARSLFLASLAPNTRASYHSGQKSFLNFCAHIGVTEPLPATSTDTCMWLASLAARSLRFTTIDNYRYALHSLHTDLGLPSILDSDPYQRDDRTDHQSLPVESGTKFGVNYWIHMYPFREKSDRGCGNQAYIQNWY